MTDPLPFDARLSPAFAIHTWVADLTHLGPYRDALIADVVELIGPGPRGQDPGVTEPTLQDRSETRWVDLITAVVEFCDALASELRPSWRHREIHAWGTIRFSGVVGAAVDPNTAYDAATYSCLVWLQVPRHLLDAPLALRDPLYHLQERYGRPGYAAVAPNELKMFVFPGFLERFHRSTPSQTDWDRPAVLVQVDVCYY